MPTPISQLAASLIVALGGGTGAVLRYQLGRLVSHLAPGQALSFPWATLAANALGSAAMGVLIAWLARHDAAGAGGGEQWRLLLGVGLLGGFTTFSAFSLETMLMIDRGQALMAMVYALASVGGAVCALGLGLMLTRSAGA